MVTVTQPAPHIIELEANNGWIGFAYYLADKDEYHGFFELQTIPNVSFEEHWADKVFIIKLIFERFTLNLEAEAEGISFSSTYRKHDTEMTEGTD